MKSVTNHGSLRSPAAALQCTLLVLTALSMLCSELRADATFRELCFQPSCHWVALWGVHSGFIVYLVVFQVMKVENLNSLEKLYNLNLL